MEIEPSTHTAITEQWQRDVRQVISALKVLLAQGLEPAQQDQAHEKERIAIPSEGFVFERRQ